MDDEVVRSARISTDKNKFLEENDIAFKDLVNEAINGKIEEKQIGEKKQKILTKKQKINKVAVNGFYCILGMFLFMLLGQQNNLIATIIIGGMASLFTAVGAVNLYLMNKEDNIFAGRKK